MSVARARRICMGVSVQSTAYKPRIISTPLLWRGTCMGCLVYRTGPSHVEDLDALEFPDPGGGKYGFTLHSLSRSRVTLQYFDADSNDTITYSALNNFG